MAGGSVEFPNHPPSSDAALMTHAEPCLVSVVVYSNGDIAPLAVTLASLAQQTFPGFEVLISPTSSGPDHSAAVMELTAHSGLRARVAAATVLTVSSAARRNCALEATDGPYVLELSAGDELDPTALEQCVWALETRPRAGLAILDGSSHNGWTSADCANLEARAACSATHVFVLRRSAWCEVMRFDEEAPDNVVDCDLHLRIVESGWAVVPLAGWLARRRSGERSVDTSGPAADSGLQWLRARHRVFFDRAQASSRLRRPVSKVVDRVPVLGSVARRITSKLEQDGLTDVRQVVRHPVDAALRLWPERFKGPRWAQSGLPVRVNMWNEVPVLRETPAALLAAELLPGHGADDGRIRVLVLHPYLIAGGAETVLLNLFTHVDKSRFDMHLIATESISGEPTQDHWAQKFAAQARSVYTLPSFLEREDFLGFIIDFIHSRSIDVLLISLVPFGYHALPEIRAHCPGVVVVDLLHAEAPYIPMDSIRLASRYRTLIDRRVVITEHLRSVQITKYGESPERVVVIPNGIDTVTLFNPGLHSAGALRSEFGLDSRTSIVLFFGRFAMEKQPLHVVRVAGCLKDRADIAFVLLGDGPEGQELEAEVRRRGLKNVFFGPARHEIAEALADTTVVLFPSKREGLPMAGIESLAMGKPVVAANVPGWAELIDDGEDGVLVEDGDFRAYAQAIEDLVDDPIRYARMSGMARRKASARFSVIDSVRAWETLFLDLCAGGRQ